MALSAEELALLGGVGPAGTGQSQPADEMSALIASLPDAKPGAGRSVLSRAFGMIDPRAPAAFPGESTSSRITRKGMEQAKANDAQEAKRFVPVTGVGEALTRPAAAGLTRATTGGTAEGLAGPVLSVGRGRYQIPAPVAAAYETALSAIPAAVEDTSSAVGAGLTAAAGPIGRVAGAVVRPIANAADAVAARAVRAVPALADASIGPVRMVSEKTVERALTKAPELIAGAERAGAGQIAATPSRMAVAMRGASSTPPRQAALANVEGTIAAEAAPTAEQLLASGQGTRVAAKPDEMLPVGAEFNVQSAAEIRAGLEAKAARAQLELLQHEVAEKEARLRAIAPGATPPASAASEMGVPSATGQAESEELARRRAAVAAAGEQEARLREVAPGVQGARPPTGEFGPPDAIATAESQRLAAGRAAVAGAEERLAGIEAAERRAVQPGSPADEFGGRTPPPPQRVEPNRGAVSHVDEYGQPSPVTAKPITPAQRFGDGPPAKPLAPDIEYGAQPKPPVAAPVERVPSQTVDAVGEYGERAIVKPEVRAEADKIVKAVASEAGDEEAERIAAMFGPRTGESGVVRAIAKRDQEALTKMVKVERFTEGPRKGQVKTASLVGVKETSGGYIAQPQRRLKEIGAGPVGEILDNAELQAARMGHFGEERAGAIYAKHGIKEGSPAEALMWDIGEAKATPEILAQAASEGVDVAASRRAAAEIKDLLEAFGHYGRLPPSRWLDDYLPHLIKGRDASKLPPDMAVLQQAFTKRGAKSAFLEKHRTGAEGYVKGMEALRAYFRSVARDVEIEAPVKEIRQMLALTNAGKTMPNTNAFIGAILDDMTGAGTRRFEGTIGSGLGKLADITARGMRGLGAQHIPIIRGIAKDLEGFALESSVNQFSKANAAMKQAFAAKTMGLNLSTPTQIMSDLAVPIAKVGPEQMNQGRSLYMKAIGLDGPADKALAAAWYDSGLPAISASRVTHGEISVHGALGDVADKLLIGVRAADLATKGPTFFAGYAKHLAEHPGDILGARRAGVALVEESQQLFLKSTLPELMRSAPARMSLAYFNPGMKMGSMQWDMVRKALKGDPGARATAARMIAVSSAFMAGGLAVGVPIYRNFMPIYRKGKGLLGFGSAYWSGGMTPVGSLEMAALKAGTGDQRGAARDVEDAIQGANPLSQRAIQGPLSAMGLEQDGVMKAIFNLRKQKKTRLGQILQAAGFNPAEAESSPPTGGRYGSGRRY